MSFNSPSAYSSKASQNSILSTSESRFVSFAYLWMAAGLIVTAVVAEIFSKDMAFQNYLILHRYTWILFLAVELFVLVAIQGASGYRLRSRQFSRARSVPAPLVAFLFFAFAAINGAFLSSLLLTYTSGSLIGCFGGGAVLFISMGAFGFTTRHNLSPRARVVIGLLLAFLVLAIIDALTASSTLSIIVGIIGVPLFAWRAAADTQTLRNMSHSMDESSHEVLAISGAVALYLDFMNLFLSLLRIFGNVR